MAGSTINSVTPHSQVRVTQGVSSAAERNQPVQGAEQKQQALSFKDGFDPAKKQDPVALNPLDARSGQGNRVWLSAKPTLPGGEGFSALRGAGGPGKTPELNHFNSAKPTLPPFEGGPDTFSAWSFDGGHGSSRTNRMPDGDASSKPTLPGPGPISTLSMVSGAGRIGGARRPNSAKPTLPPFEGGGDLRATSTPKGERGRSSRAQQQEQVRQMTFETLNLVRFARIQG